METAAAPALDIIMGTRRGETRRAPFSPKTRIWVSRVSRPPTPVPMITPDRPGIGVELAGVVEGHVGHGHGELGEPVDLAGLLGGEPLLGVEVGDPALTLGGGPVEPGPERVGARCRSTTTTPMPVMATRRPATGPSGPTPSSIRAWR